MLPAVNENGGHMVSTGLADRILEAFVTADRSVAALRQLVDHRRTIPRELAHRRSVSEVFVCDRARIAPEQFVIAVQMPRAHTLWSDGHHGYHDTLMAAEAIRQAAIMAGHDYFEISTDTVMVARTFDLAVLAPEAFRNDRRNPLEGVLLFTVSPMNPGSDRPSGLTFETTMLIGARPAMTMSGSLIIATASDFALVRAMSRAQRGRRPQPMPAAVGEIPAPAAVGRASRQNMAIRVVTEPPGAERISVLVDLDNPVFFDHQLDHVPGQLITEAIRQAATHGLSRVSGGVVAGVPMVTGGRAAFEGFAELDAPAELDVTVHPLASRPGAYQVDAVVVQLNKQIGAVALQMEFPADSGRIGTGEEQ